MAESRQDIFEHPPCHRRQRPSLATSAPGSCAALALGIARQYSGGGGGQGGMPWMLTSFGRLGSMDAFRQLPVSLRECSPCRNLCLFASHHRPCCILTRVARHSPYTLPMGQKAKLAKMLHASKKLISPATHKVRLRSICA